MVELHFLRRYLVTSSFYLRIRDQVASVVQREIRQEAMSLPCVSGQIDPTGEPAHELKDLTRKRSLRLLLQCRHGQDFPLTSNSEAVYSTKALWRSTLAVIIQPVVSRAGLPYFSRLPEPKESEARRSVWLLVTPAESVSV